jgi:hypothetical protein
MFDPFGVLCKIYDRNLFGGSETLSGLVVAGKSTKEIFS